MIRLALSLCALSLTARPAFADVPVIDDAVVKLACDAARAQDACPTCKCGMRTSTSPYPGLDERTSDIIFGVVLDVEGDAPDGSGAFAAAHVALGTASKLEHIGRIARSGNLAENRFVQYDIVAGSAEMQMCPGDCGYETVGLIHPFEVTTTDSVSRPLDDGTVEDTIREETRLVLCFEAAGGLTCASVLLAAEERVARPPMAPGMKLKVLAREGFKRTWKFGKAGDIALGKATGKLSKQLAHAEAHKLSMMDLFSDTDTRPIER